MAKRAGKGSAAPAIERATPLAPLVALVLGFLLLAAVGVVTVVVPELTDDGEGEDEAGAPADAPGAPAEPAAGASPPVPAP